MSLLAKFTVAAFDTSMTVPQSGLVIDSSSTKALEKPQA
jgi:hypothetical protein